MPALSSRLDVRGERYAEGVRAMRNALDEVRERYDAVTARYAALLAERSRRDAEFRAALNGTRRLAGVPRFLHNARPSKRES